VAVGQCGQHLLQADFIRDEVIGVKRAARFGQGLSESPELAIGQPVRNRGAALGIDRNGDAWPGECQQQAADQRDPPNTSHVPKC
jgi:hypothetical protein